MIRVLETPEELSKAAAELFIEAAAASIKKKGKFLVSLSGGSTPKRAFEILAEPANKVRVQWENVHIFWGDERCVPFVHPESNAGMTFKALLEHVSVPQDQTHIIKGDLPPHDAALVYNELLKKYFAQSDATFDLVFLGMGTDGHTASLFPYTPVLDENSFFAKEVYLEDLKKFRITITKNVINRASKVAFLISGENKAEVLKEVMYGDYNYRRYPSQLIKPINGEIIWLLDKGAAKFISK